MDFDEMLEEIRELGRKFDSLIRLGKVTEVHAEARAVKVRFDDRDEAESNYLPVLCWGSDASAKPEQIPVVEELAVVLSLPQGMGHGIVLGVISEQTRALGTILGWLS